MSKSFVGKLNAIYPSAASTHEYNQNYGTSHDINPIFSRRWLTCLAPNIHCIKIYVSQLAFLQGLYMLMTEFVHESHVVVASLLSWESCPHAL